MAGAGHAVAVFLGEALAAYGFGMGHPFGPDRHAAFAAGLARAELLPRVAVQAPVAATAAELERFHTADWVARVRRLSAAGTGFLDYGDTPAFPGVYEAAASVVGSTLAAVAGAVAGHHPRAFVPIAGLHHGRRDAAAGFCVFNDLGVAIETLRAVHGLRRVAYVDIDAHHGDGVYYEFEDDPEVFVADLHQDGRFLYPGTGAATETGRGAARGTKLNVPLPPGADDALFQTVWPRVEEVVRRARPELILLQAGADSLAGDPLAGLAFSPRVHEHAATRLAALADELCGGRLVATGGGGYDHGNVVAAWNGVVRALLGEGRLLG